MKNNTRKENKACFILYLITSVLFFLSGLANLTTEGLNKWCGITNICLGITFFSISIMYCKKYKSQK